MADSEKKTPGEWLMNVRIHKNDDFKKLCAMEPSAIHSLVMQYDNKVERVLRHLDVEASEENFGEEEATLGKLFALYKKRNPTEAEVTSLIRPFAKVHAMVRNGIQALQASSQGITLVEDDE